MGVPRAVKASARSRTRSPCASEVLLNVMKHVADQCQFVVKADTVFPCSRLACRTHGKHGLEPTSVKLFALLLRCLVNSFASKFACQARQLPSQRGLPRVAKVQFSF